MDGNGDQPVRHSGRADESSGARDDSRSRGQRLDRGRHRTDSCAWTIGDARTAGSRRARQARTCRRSSRIGTATSGSAPIAASSGGAIPCSPRSRRRRAFPRRPSDPCTSTIEDARGLRRRAAACSGSRTAWSAASRKRASIATSSYSIAGAGDEVWVGRQRGGVTRLRRSAAGWSAMRLTEAEGLPQNSVYACRARARRRALGGHAERGREPDRERGRHDLHDRERPGLQYHHVDRRRRSTERSGSERQAGSAHSRGAAGAPTRRATDCRRTTSIRSSWVRAASSGPARQTDWRSCRTVSCARAGECPRPCARRSSVWPWTSRDRCG